MKTTKHAELKVILPPALRDRIQAEAPRHDRSVSGLIRIAMTQFLDEMDAQREKEQAR